LRQNFRRDQLGDAPSHFHGPALAGHEPGFRAVIAGRNIRESTLKSHGIQA